MLLFKDLCPLVQVRLTKDYAPEDRGAMYIIMHESFDLYDKYGKLLFKEEQVVIGELV